MSYTDTEIRGFEAEKALIIEKIAELRQALVLEMNAGTRFSYEHTIRQLEARKNEITKKLGEAFGLDTDSGKARLREKVKDLKISGPMGVKHLVNCNRRELRDRFEETFDRFEKLRKTDPKFINHFYFLSACPKQMPHSLVDLMIHEVLGDWMAEGTEEVHRQPDEINYDRLKLEIMPIGYSLEKSQEQFKDFCRRWFNWGSIEEFSDAISANRLPLTKNKYTILIFDLQKDEWKSFFSEYFDWIAEQLSNRPVGGPTLLIFFILHIDLFHEGYEQKKETRTDAATGAATEQIVECFADESVGEIIRSVNGICERHPNARHLYPFYPVRESDLLKWFSDLGERNPARIKPVLDTVVEGLPEDELEQYRQPRPVPTDQPAPLKPEPRKLLNMARVELVQEIVFDFYNQ